MELNYYNTNYGNTSRKLLDDYNYSETAKKYFYFQRFNLLAGYRTCAAAVIANKLLLEVKHYYDTNIKQKTYDNLNLDEKIYTAIMLNNF